MLSRFDIGRQLQTQPTSKLSFSRRGVTETRLNLPGKDVPYFAVSFLVTQVQWVKPLLPVFVQS